MVGLVLHAKGWSEGKQCTTAWSAARVALQEAVRNPVGTNQHNSGGAAHRAAADPTLAADRKPTDRKSRTDLRLHDPDKEVDPEAARRGRSVVVELLR